MLLRRTLTLFILLAATLTATSQTTAHTLSYAPGKSITLTLPSDLTLNVAATGLRRVRFFAESPDHRIFVTGMYNLAFWTDPATHQTWLYLPLTDKLVRYRYSPGDEHPTGPPETLIRFPDYGLNYKYGGWHLTRTVAIATLHGQTHVYIAAGSSCNYCHEREALRAAVLRMNPDGSDPRIVAQGLRNAVDLRFVPNLDGGALFATNMGDDHLGTGEPEDTFFELDSNAHPGPVPNDTDCPTHVIPGGTVRKKCVIARPANYGWPTCFFTHGKPTLDTTPLPDMPPPGDLNTESERPAEAGTPSHSRPPEAD